MDVDVAEKGIKIILVIIFSIFILLCFEFGFGFFWFFGILGILGSLGYLFLAFIAFLAIPILLAIKSGNHNMQPERRTQNNNKNNNDNNHNGFMWLALAFTIPPFFGLFFGDPLFSIIMFLVFLALSMNNNSK